MKNFQNDRLSKYSLIVLGLAAIVHLLVFAKSVLLPVLFSFYLSILIYKPMMYLKNILYYKAISALIPVIILFFGILLIVLFSYEPAIKKVESLPKVANQLQHHIAPINKVITELNVKTKEVEALVNKTLNSDSELSESVVIKKNNAQWYNILFEELSNLLWYFSITFLLCYFFLVGGDSLAKNIACTFKNRLRRKTFLHIVKKIRNNLSHYLAITLFVNLSYGALVASLLAIFNVDFALLWGALVGLSRYIPYVGNILSLALIAIVVAENSPDLTAIMIAPAITALLMFITGNFIDPLVHARQFHLNPIFVFIAIIFWSWIWGVPGLFIAVPTLVVIAVICGEVASLNRIYIVLCLNPNKDVIYTYKKALSQG